MIQHHFGTGRNCCCLASLAGRSAANAGWTFPQCQWNGCDHGQTHVAAAEVFPPTVSAEGVSDVCH